VVRLPLEETTEPEPTYSVSGLYAVLGRALSAAVGPSVWVRGEIRQLSTSKAGHHYLDLADTKASPGRPPAVLKVVCFSSDWPRVTAPLEEAGRELAEGMVVRVRGSVGLYAPASQVSLTLEELDVEDLLGRIALERQRLLQALAREGLLEAQKALPLPPVPLRVGLVASPGTEGCRDFLGQLEASGFGFEVRLCPSTVQGAGAPGELARAVRVLDSLGAGVDVLVLVRGGGSKADLAAFDAEPVVRAVAGARHPVLVGIGHTGDQSLVDLVAHGSHPTPTACAKALVEHVRGFTAAVGASTRALERLAADALDDAGTRLAGAARRAEAAAGLLERTEQTLVHTARRLRSVAEPRLERPQRELGDRAERLGRRARPRRRGCRSSLRSASPTPRPACNEGPPASPSTRSCASGRRGASSTPTTTAASSSGATRSCGTPEGACSRAP
jgi:exodeoxyribonuclease VII large subunit